MKKLLLASVILALHFMGWAQSPAVLHYKFLIYDNGTPVTTAVDIKFRIKSGTTVLWEETHQGVVPDANGIAAIAVGTGTQTGGSLTTLDDLDWSQQLSYDVEVDTGSGYTTMVSDARFLYVPKAKYAEHGDFNGLSNKPVTFLLAGTTNYPTSIDDDIYHTGKVSIGTADLPGNSSLRVVNSESGVQVGLSSVVDASDNANKTAAYHSIDNAGNGYLKAMAGKISASGNGTHVGNWIQVDGSGSGTHLGTYNRMFGSGTGYQAAVLNEIRNSGNDYHVGVYNWITNNGNGEHYGLVNQLEGAGDGLQVGVSTTIVNSGIGDKYGTYIYIDPSSPGLHYGIYADVPGTNAYAGYFNGNVFVADKLKALITGDADMKAYLYGKVSSSGSIDSQVSTPGFTVSGSGGHYIITFDTALPDDYYIVVASIEGVDFGFIRVEKSSSGFEVYTADTSGTLAARDFTFVVYRK